MNEIDTPKRKSSVLIGNKYVIIKLNRNLSLDDDAAN